MKARRKLTILVTGFGPFPGVRVNPSAQIAHDLAGARRFQRLGLDVKAHIFPTRWSAAARDLPGVIDRARPDAVLHLGVAARRRFIAVETIARPSPSMISPDAGGASVSGLTKRGLVALRIAAPAGPLLASLRRATEASRLSNSAGRYLCNAIYHQSLDLRRDARAVRPTVFIHVPMPGAESSRLPSARIHTRKPGSAATLRGLEHVMLTLALAARREKAR